MLFANLKVYGQENPIADSKNVKHQENEWLHYYNKLIVSKKTFITTDGGIRRRETFKNWEEYIIRLGVNYRFNLRMNAGLGAAYIYSFVTRYPEIRFHQEINTSNKDISVLTITNRLRLEERIFGTGDSIIGSFGTTQFNYRARYRLSIYVPFFKDKITDDTFFLVGEDEIFLNLGRSIISNVFDRNRIGLGLGYRYNKNFTAIFNYNYQFEQVANIDYLHTDILWLSLFHTFDFTNQKKQIPSYAGDD